MTRPLPDLQYDVAAAVSRGRRDHQEDAIVTDFPIGGEIGFAVLADGMGGHAAGDVASKIIVTEVFSELKLQSGDPGRFESRITEILTDAALAANQCLEGHVRNNPEAAGMGATLVAPVVIRNRLFWISVGDSPLFLFRDGILRQLNEDHSMAPQIDFMAQSGLIGPEMARDHPDRNCLTSVLIGGEVARIDCPSDPIELCAGDLVIVASDGLQTLSNKEIEDALRSDNDRPSSEIARTLLARVSDCDDPDQDNVSFSVIRVCETAQVRGRRTPRLTLASGGNGSDTSKGLEKVSASRMAGPLRFVRRHILHQGHAG